MKKIKFPQSVTILSLLVIAFGIGCSDGIVGSMPVENAPQTQLRNAVSIHAEIEQVNGQDVIASSVLPTRSSVRLTMRIWLDNRYDPGISSTEWTVTQSPSHSRLRPQDPQAETTLLGFDGPEGFVPQLDAPGDYTLDACAEIWLDATADLVTVCDSVSFQVRDSAFARYLPQMRHSPCTGSIIQKWKNLLAAAGRRPDVFAKVGDSITWYPTFLTCFHTKTVDEQRLSVLNQTYAYTPLLAANLEESRLFFSQSIIDGEKSSSFNRRSYAAYPGWVTKRVLDGQPSYLQSEIQAINPAFAVVMLGTNDTSRFQIARFDTDLNLVLTALIDQGVVPLLSTIPPRGDYEYLNNYVPEMNAIIRAQAQRHQVLLMDLWSTLIDLTAYGLEDRVHLATYWPTGEELASFRAPFEYPCAMSDKALSFGGMNQRNLLTLEALNRARRFLLQDDKPEEPPPLLSGCGTAEAPFRVDSLPFVDALDPESFSGCDSENTDGSNLDSSLSYEIDPDLLVGQAARNLSIRLYIDPGPDRSAELLVRQGQLEVRNATDQGEGKMAAACLAVDPRQPLSITINRPLSADVGYRLVAVPLNSCNPR